MILVFDEVPNEGLSFDCNLQLPESTDSDRGPVTRGPLRLVGRATHGERGIDLSARLEGTLRLECGRCLEPVERPLHTDFFLILVSAASEFGSGEARVEAGDAQLYYAEQGRVDLSEVAREQVYLNFPQKTVCSDDCTGICPTCGGNRNRIECSCPTGEIDPRLAPLQDLKKKLGGC